LERVRPGAFGPPAPRPRTAQVVRSSSSTSAGQSTS
jgi:hypothetical protein